MEITARIALLSTATPALCAVCRRHAGPRGYAPRGLPPLWDCGDEECREIIKSKRLFRMSVPDFDELEMQGLVAAARAGKAYLESIGAGALVSAFAALEPYQALEFLERVVDGFGCHLKSKLVLDRNN